MRSKWDLRASSGKAADAREVNPSPQRNRSTGYVKDCVGFVRILLQRLDRLGRREHEQFDMPAPRFALYFSHDRQGAGSGTDDQLAAFPRYLLFDRQRCVAKG